jgi:nucleotide-binding universal stress UspA family protein
LVEEERQSFLIRHAADLGIDPVAATGGQEDYLAIEELTRSAEAYLSEQARAIRMLGLTVTVRAAVGEPAECIAEVAQRMDGCLIVMGTHGYSGVRRWMLGSIADRVAHSTTAPVLLVRSSVTPTEPPELHRILVPLDGSALAQQALPVAAELARATGSELVLLRVVLPFDTVVPALSPLGRPISVAAELVSEELEGARQQLWLAAQTLDHGDLQVTPIVETGYAADTIVDAALHPHADLIVMATHGRSGVKRWALGSVADKVLHAAKAPVLLVRAQAELA